MIIARSNNRLVPGSSAAQAWEQLPPVCKNAFQAAFGKSLHDPSLRSTPTQWNNVLKTDEERLVAYMKDQNKALINPFTMGRELLASIRRVEAEPKADFVFVISATKPMQPFWDHMLGSVADIPHIMASIIPINRLDPSQARLRLIAFKDMYMFRQPFLCSPFYDLPQDAESMKAFIRGIDPKSMGNERSSGLEAFLLAMYSDWRRDGDAVKHIIVLITDCPPYSLREPLRAFDPRYEQVLNQFIPYHDLALPRTEEDLRLCWLNGVGTMDNWNNFMFIYGPQSIEWQAFASWDEISLQLIPVAQTPFLSLQTIFSDLRSVL